MKKIFTILALVMASVMSWATVSISINPSVIDFGTLTLSEDGDAEASTTATLTWSGLQPYCSVFVDTIGKPAADADYEFWVKTTYGYDYWYGGDMYTDADEPTVNVGFYALAAGEYEIKYSFYSYEDDYWEVKSEGVELVVRAKVVAPGEEEGATGLSNTAAQTKAFKKVIDGQMYIIRGEKMYDMTGKIAQ